MKIAYCILCHKNTRIMQTLIDMLYRDNHVYIHVDAKSNIEDFAEYINKVEFIQARENTAWGSPEAIYAIIKLLRASKTNTCDYVVLLSGDDLPIKSDKDIKQFFADNQGMEFVGVTKDALVDDRLKYIYPRAMYFKDKSLLRRIQHKLRLYNTNLAFDILPPLHKGCLWFKISANLRDYILRYVEENPQYIAAFDHSLNADEVFFHTIICNSEFRNNIYMYDSNLHDTTMCKHYIDWVSGPDRPKILYEDDYKKMQASDCLFARKMSEDIDIELFKKYFELE